MSICWGPTNDSLTADLDRSIALGIRKPTIEKVSKKNSKLPNFNQNINPNKMVTVQKATVERKLKVPYIKKCEANNQSDKEGPPQLINLLAENYRIKLTERLVGCNNPGQYPSSHQQIYQKKVVPVLNLVPHQPQKIRSVHFFPEQGDTIPRHATVFDIDFAIKQFNDRITERQELAISYAEMICEPTSPRQSQYASTAQRSAPKLMFEKIQCKNKPSLPIKQPMKKVSHIKTGPFQGSNYLKQTDEKNESVNCCLADALTINKVGIPSPRRANTQKKIHHQNNPQLSKPPTKEFSKSLPSKLYRMHSSKIVLDDVEIATPPQISQYPEYEDQFMAYEKFKNGF